MAARRHDRGFLWLSGCRASAQVGHASQAEALGDFAKPLATGRKVEDRRSAEVEDPPKEEMTRRSRRSAEVEDPPKEERRGENRPKRRPLLSFSSRACQSAALLLNRLKRGEKGKGPFCRNGPKGASHKMDLSPFPCPFGSLEDLHRLATCAGIWARAAMFQTHT
jgi:hypothetical protein